MSKLAVIGVSLDRITDRLIGLRDVAKRAPEPSKLTIQGAMVLHSTDVVVARLRKATKIAEEIQKLTRRRYRHLIPLSEDSKEREKGICEIEVGRFKLRVAPVEGGERFSLKAYREAGYKVTARMQEHISTSDPYDRWTVSDATGPRRADAVEASAADAAISTLF